MVGSKHSMYPKNFSGTGGACGVGGGVAATGVAGLSGVNGFGAFGPFAMATGGLAAGGGGAWPKSKMLR